MMTFTSGGELVIKDTDTPDGSSPTITLQSGDTDIAQDDVLELLTFKHQMRELVDASTDAILVLQYQIQLIPVVMQTKLILKQVHLTQRCL